MLMEMINRYIELQQAMGFKYRIQSCLLRHFAEFAIQQHGDAYVRCKTVIDWAGLAPSRAQRRNRLLTVRRFAISMQAEDKRYEVPPPDVFGRETFIRRIPHILSSKELKLLLTAALDLKPKNTIRPMTYATLFALLAATGLRISEAIALKVQDVTDDGLIIRATKFHKDRLVPLHKSTQQGIQHYLNYRNRFGSIDSSLFISNNRLGLHYSTVFSIFLQLARSVGLRDGPGHPGVYIHDLRHRFAVKSLEQCIGDHIAVSQHMIALSTYLGHVHISDTYWYLHSTPVLMKKIAKTQELFYKKENQ